MAEHQKLDQENSYEAEQTKRIQQSIDTLNKAADKIEHFLEKNEPRIGQGKSKKGRFFAPVKPAFPMSI